MKNLLSATFLYLSIVLLVHSCEYEPAGTYNQDVDQNAPPPHLQIVELNMNSDTIVVYNQCTVKFTFNTEYKNVHAVRLLIDNTEKGIVNANSGEFQLLAGFIFPGIYDMVLEVYTGSGTGSLAETMGAEGYVFKKSWKLVVRYWSEHETRSSVVDGLLHLKMPEYDGTNFEEFIICRFDNLYNEIEIGRSADSEFIDSTYVGEGAQYIIRVKNSDGSIFTLEYPRLFPDLPELSFATDTLNRYRALWTRSRYYGAVDSYSVFVGHEYMIYNLVKSTHDVQDTTCYPPDCYFGDKIFLKLRVVPRNPNVWYVPERYSAFEKEIYPELGYPFPVKDFLNDLYPVNQDEFIYALGCDSLIRYSISGRRVVEKTSHTTPDYYCCEFISISASASGNFVTGRIGCWNNIMFAASGALGSYTEINQRNITGGAGTEPVPVSDAGTGLLRDGDDNLVVYDFLNSRVLGTHIRNSFYPLYPSGLKFSSGGDYLFINDDSLRLIHFADNEFNTVMRIRKPADNAVFEFDAVDPGRYIFWDGISLKVMRCDNSSSVYEFPLSEALLDIDYRNNEILTYASGLLNVRSFSDGSLITNVAVNFIPSWGKTCFLMNHTIIYTAGLMFFIN